MFVSPLPFQDTALGVMALAFAVMGGTAFFSPVRITRLFEILDLSAAGRNEVRAVYGGFGLAVSALLVTSLFWPPLRTGVCLTVAVALLGMAGGRGVSALLDRTLGRIAFSFLLIELLGAALLLYSIRGEAI